MTRVLVFDTETTGLLNSNPYITQLSCLIYNIENKKIERCLNSYVKIPEEVIIPEIVTKLTGITKEICNEKGNNIQDVLVSFYEEYMVSDIIVSHNIEFDKAMIQLEINRIIENNKNTKHIYLKNLFNDKYDKIFNIKHYCTMKTTIQFCNIKKNEKYKTLKYPKLIELYEKLFQTKPENLHNSEIDTLVCLRCYLKMVYKIDINYEEALLSIL
jgi:DNA polymerase III epsilon subunit-like protein